MVLNIFPVLDRLVRLEVRSRNQEDRLAKQEFNTKQAETRLNELETRIVKLSEKNTDADKLGTEILTRNERPVRLLPFTVLHG